MSWQPAERPDTSDRFSCTAIETVIVPRVRDIGGFDVRRVLPAARRRMVGPFIFLDQMGPVELAPGQGLDVRPHPHIGLETVTYLFEGTILHRDSLGSVQPITPGAVNWMTAGSGIVHSERSPPELRRGAERVFGLQSWVALPAAREETAPAFAHYPVNALPDMDGDGIHARIIAGRLYGRSAPVRTQSDLFYGDITLAAGARLPIEADYEERAAYLVSGTVEIEGDRFESGRMLTFAPNVQIIVRALEAARLVILGGAPMDGPRYIWWNFVSSRHERIEQAKEDWRQGRFEAVPGETEFIPLPENGH